MYTFSQKNKRIETFFLLSFLCMDCKTCDTCSKVAFKVLILHHMKLIRYINVFALCFDKSYSILELFNQLKPDSKTLNSH